MDSKESVGVNNPTDAVDPADAYDEADDGDPVNMATLSTPPPWRDPVASTGSAPLAGLLTLTAPVAPVEPHPPDASNNALASNMTCLSSFRILSGASGGPPPG